MTAPNLIFSQEPVAILMILRARFVCFSTKPIFQKKKWDKKTAAPITEKLHVAINLRMNKYRNSSTSQRPAWKKIQE
jgi:hypothetical protein